MRGPRGERRTPPARVRPRRAAARLVPDLPPVHRPERTQLSASAIPRECATAGILSPPRLLANERGVLVKRTTTAREPANNPAGSLAVALAHRQLAPPHYSS